MLGALFNAPLVFADRVEQYLPPLSRERLEETR